jgi:general secretion pathway protein F/type IV pilus assembly protein PilC
VPDFTYEAMANSGQRTQGTLTAGSEREVLAMLDARGLYPIKIAAAKAPVGSFTLGGGIKTKHMTAFYSQLADLLHSGVPLLRSLDILENQSGAPALGAVLRELRASVADGTSLADAMAQHPRAFNELAVSMVRAGQEGGFLEDVLKRIAEFTEAQEDLKASVVGALAYPVFLMTVGFGVLNALVIFIVPIFEKSLFASLRAKGELPILTSFLVEASHFMQGHFPSLFALLLVLLTPRLLLAFRPPKAGQPGVDPLTVIVLQLVVVAIGGGLSTLISGLNVTALVLEMLVALVIGGIQYYAATGPGRLMIDGWKLRIPAIGPIFLSLALARFTRLMGTLLKNGIPILQALRIAKDSTANKVLVTALEKSAENITGGESLASPLRACSFFPRDVVEMIAVAEESNTLDKVLVQISETLEKRTKRQLELFVRLLEPMMLLVMGTFVGVILAGLLIPIFKANQAFGGG